MKYRKKKKKKTILKQYDSAFQLGKLPLVWVMVFFPTKMNIQVVKRADSWKTDNVALFAAC